MPPKPPDYYTDKLFTCDDMDKAIQKEREECAKMFEKSPALLECAKNAFGGCLICGFTPELAMNAIRARGQE